MKKYLLKLASVIILLSFFLVFITVSCKNTIAKTGSAAAAEITSSSTISKETTTKASVVETTVSETSDETSSTQTATSTTFGRETKLTQQQAIDIAMTVASGTVDRVETEIEDGRLIWKIRIISDSVKTNVRIDDETGKVIRVDTD